MPKIQPKEKTGYDVFRGDLSPYLLKPDLEYVMMAYTVSNYGHRTQMRANGDTYFTHPKAVALIVFELSKGSDLRILSKMLAAALLHDIIEDTHLLNDWMITRIFGRQVALWVKKLTKNPEKGYLERLKRYTEWQVLIIKLADRLHNLQTLDSFDEVRRQRYLKETREHYFSIAERCIALMPKKYRTKGEQLRNEIERICRSYR